MTQRETCSVSLAVRAFAAPNPRNRKREPSGCCHGSLFIHSSFIIPGLFITNFLDFAPPFDIGLNRMPTDYERVVEIFGMATDENLADSMRQHQVVHLPAQGDVWIAGDVHDHRRNFDKLLRFADLP